MLVQVAVARKLAAHQDILTYHVPERLQPVDWGSMVLAPMGRGNQQVNGYVVGLESDDGKDISAYKDILAVPEPTTLLTRELVELALWISRYYVCPCYYVLEYMLPKFARSKKKETVVWNGDSALAQAQLLLLDGQAGALARQIRQKGSMPLAAVRKQWPQADQLLQQLEQAQLVRRQIAYGQQGGSREEYVYESCIAAAQLDAAQKQLGRAVRQWEILRFLTYQGPCSGHVLRSHWPGYLSR